MGRRRKRGRRRRSGGAQWGDDLMEVDDVEELSDDKDADMEKIQKLKVSRLGYSASVSFNVH